MGAVMKLWIKSLILLTLAMALGRTERASAMSMSSMSATHGMVVFGDKTIYASHMPMFQEPHNFQVVFEIQLDEAAVKIYNDAEKTALNGLITILPEPFVLEEMIANPTAFKATLYSGHFERGGQALATIDVSIVKVAYSRKLEAPVVGQANAITFGHKGDWYRLHVINQAPDYDQIDKIEIGLRGETLSSQTIYREDQDLQ